MNMNESFSRIGRFTSSGIYQLMANGRKSGEVGKPFLSYVQKKAREKKIFRSLDNDTTSRELSWGNLNEKRCFKLLGFEYSLSSQETLEHPTIENYAGSPDGMYNSPNGNAVYDIKCPFSLNSYFNFIENDIEGIRENHSDGEKYYWQLVSNAIITGVDKAQLIIYVPYQRELVDIRLEAKYDANADHLSWLSYAEDSSLPYIPERSLCRNLHICEFDVPQSDKDALEARLLMANELIKKL